ncbi:MAG: 3-deoxy-7-phosphoheptulonate synthase, partial [Chloroflexota bacterium]|nr:3-deoxy-7-phosphoheptulonate synthase [Chloroflexota bacterium]
MIITISAHATSEERAHLLAELHRFVGSQQPIATVHMDGHEVIALDSSSLDSEAKALLARLQAVEQILPIATPYKLVSRAFKAESSHIVVGDALGGNPCMIGGPSPIIIAGPCAIENREQLLSIASRVKIAGAHMLRGGAFKPRTSP